jgi:hypothetical protein
MSSNFNPWWKRVNDYLLFQEKEEFLRGVGGYRPNNRQEAMFGQLVSGYVRNQFQQPKSHTGKDVEKHTK